ncbi:MAG: DUF3634 family protein [Candidatus Aegiribacteria sp.]|nr:DUF3634 family protein [Candidatus Aegiribacteria sp.]
MSDLIKILLRRISPPLFTIRITDRAAVLTAGQVTPALLRDWSEIARKNNIVCGWIWGLRTGSCIRLDFSSNISKNDRQRFRNIMAIHAK